jgi:endonuclease/exonuclease/phosphatase family metal-dependent hydrolase
VQRLPRPGRWPLAVCVALATAIAAVDLLVGDRTAWGEAIAIWPSPLWLLGLLPLSALAFRGGLVTGLPALATCIIFLLLTTEWRSMLRWPDAQRQERFEALRRTPGPGGTGLRLVVWNVAGRTPLPALRELGADVALLQEATPPAAAGAPDWNWQGNLDPGVLSRYPLRRLPSASIGPWAEPVVVEVELPGRPLIAVCVRLVLPAVVRKVASPGDPVDLGAEHARRVAQFSDLAELLGALHRDHADAALLLAGDFNAPACLPSARPLQQLLRDVWPEAGLGWGGTMTEDMPLARIDQAWISPEIEAVAARVVRRSESDHRALVVDLLVQGPPSRQQAPW